MVTPLKQPIVFHLEGFYVPPGYGAFLFFLALFYYIVMLLANGVVLCVIVMDKNLHRPMFVMVCNLVVCDLLGATAVLPRLMMHFLMGQKKIAYIPAITQAFSVHMYGAAVQTVLAVMAYDRYIAVCEPLRYHAIMTPARLHSCCGLAWFIAVLLIAVLFIFHMNAPLCGNVIQHVYCSNRAILNLACSPTPINNIYASVVLIVSARFPSLSQNIKKFFSILFIIIPPAMNPIIYGLVSKEIRASIIKHFTNLHTKMIGV
ncbi:olfactory receptor 2K2-like [Cebidichthys violaceus]|uniref:olfactory receptor 2K2-like n=1 Tax=Cebidichthys violaceus TaxID=271503 RepID=UPI0035C94785